MSQLTGRSHNAIKWRWNHKLRLKKKRKARDLVMKRGFRTRLKQIEQMIDEVGEDALQSLTEEQQHLLDTNLLYISEAPGNRGNKGANELGPGQKSSPSKEVPSPAETNANPVTKCVTRIDKEDQGNDTVRGTRATDDTVPTTSSQPKVSIKLMLSKHKQNKVEDQPMTSQQPKKNTDDKKVSKEAMKQAVGAIIRFPTDIPKGCEHILRERCRGVRQVGNDRYESRIVFDNNHYA